MEIRTKAINFIKKLNADEKKKLKVMLNHGIVCGADFAKENNVDPVQFTEELKLIFGGK